MSYHLNIVFENKSKKPLSLEDIISILQKVDSDVKILEWKKGIKEFKMPNYNIGKFYFSNGAFWSIYESNEQLKDLIEFTKLIGLTVTGEEDEMYYENEEGLVGSIDKPEEIQSHFIKFILILNQNKLIFLIILMFLVLGFVIR